MHRDACRAGEIGIGILGGLDRGVAEVVTISSSLDRWSFKVSLMPDDFRGVLGRRRAGIHSNQ
jgi:hypothetical protein